MKSTRDIHFQAEYLQSAFILGLRALVMHITEEEEEKREVAWFWQRDKSGLLDSLITLN